MSILDDFDIESHNFKPVTSGLGFSTPKPEKKLRSSQFQKKITPIKTKKKEIHSVVANHLEETPQIMSIDSKNLEAFYGNKKPKEFKELKDQLLKPLKGKLEEADMLSQAVAFLIDFTFCLSLLYLLNMAILFPLKISYSFINVINFSLTHLMFELVLFSLFFVFYFTLFEPMGTFGKALMRLETRNYSGEPLKMFHSLKRSFSALLCLSLAGTPMMFDWHGRLSSTRVYQARK